MPSSRALRRRQAPQAGRGNGRHAQTLTHPDGGFPGRGARHALPAGHQGEPEGDAAGRRQAADPVRGGGSPRRGRAPAGVRHRRLQARHRGPLRLRPGARAAARAAGQVGPAASAAQRAAELCHLHLHPPAGAARSRPRGALRAAGGGRRAFLRASRRRSHRRRAAGARADVRCLRGPAGERDRLPGRAPCRDRQIRHRRHAGPRRHAAHPRHRREAAAVRCTLDAGGGGALPAHAAHIRPSRAHRTRRGRRDPAHRRHRPTARRGGGVRTPFRGHPL